MSQKPSNNIGKMYGFMALVVTVSFGICLYADEVVTKSGDILHGKVTGMKDGVVTLEPSYGDPISVKLEEIKGMKTDEAMKVGFRAATDEGATNMQGKVELKDETLTVTNEKDEAYEVKLKDVKILGEEAKSPYPKFKGDVQFDYSYDDGNTEAMALAFRLTLTLNVNQYQEGIVKGWGSFKEEDDPTDEDVNGKKIGKKETVRKTRFLGKYIYFLPANLGAGSPMDKLEFDLLGLVEYDYFQKLRMRAREGGGVGYRWIQGDDIIKNNPTLFQTEVGAVYTQERYQDSSKDRDFTSPFYSQDFEQKINFMSSEFIHHLEYFPRFQEFSDYVLRLENALRTHLSEHLFVEFGVIHTHVSRPVSNQEGVKEKDDVTASVSLGVSF